jgi:hypothetical protein
MTFVVVYFLTKLENVKRLNYKLAFRTRGETIEIEQLIGGKLICESTYIADIQSWYYFLNFNYQKENGETINIGKGEYFSREWKKGTTEEDWRMASFTNRWRI